MGKLDQRIERSPDLPVRVPRLVAALVDVALALHFVAAALWGWLSPKGFPLTTPQFWINSILPSATIAVATIGLWAMHCGNRRLAAAVVACFSAAWLAAAIIGRLAFPISLAGTWVVFVFVGLIGTALFALLAKNLSHTPRCCVPAVLLGAATGILVVIAQIPPPPTTIPSDPTVNSDPADMRTNADHLAPAHIALGDNVRFLPQFAHLEAISGGVWFKCRPLLEFRSTSPDRFWSLFNRQQPREPRLVGVTGEPASQTFHYDNGATIAFALPQAGQLIAATATTPIAADAYSHLNTYFYIRFNTEDAPALTFSPCGGIPFEVHPADYPFGRPARFAYLDADGTFRVCKATSGEKGPFRTLGSGRLERGAPLTIGFQVGGRQIASLVLKDWSSQLSTALSPTAGWRVPVNAIEYQLVEGGSDRYVGIWITLAGTSVGRGFDTVGHRAGTYRNRFVIRGEPAVPE